MATLVLPHIWPFFSRTGVVIPKASHKSRPLIIISSVFKLNLPKTVHKHTIYYNPDRATSPTGPGPLRSQLNASSESHGFNSIPDSFGPGGRKIYLPFSAGHNQNGFSLASPDGKRASGHRLSPKHFIRLIRALLTHPRLVLLCCHLGCVVPDTSFKFFQRLRCRGFRRRRVSEPVLFADRGQLHTALSTEFHRDIGAINFHGTFQHDRLRASRWFEIPGTFDGECETF